MQPALDFLASIPNGDYSFTLYDMYKDGHMAFNSAFFENNGLERAKKALEFWDWTSQQYFTGTKARCIQTEINNDRYTIQIEVSVMGRIYVQTITLEKRD